MVFIEHNSLKSLKFFKVQVLQGLGPGFRSSHEMLSVKNKSALKSKSKNYVIEYKKQHNLVVN